MIENEVLANSEHIKMKLPDIVRSAIRGHELVVSVKIGKEELEAFYFRYGYSVAGQYAWASELSALNNAVGISLMRGANLLCIFGHDADPIYLLSRGSMGAD
jgi:hypothetical protein